MDKHIYEITAAEQLYREHDGESVVYQEYWIPYARVVAVSRSQARVLFTRCYSLDYLTPMSIKKVLANIGDVLPQVLSLRLYEDDAPEWWEYARFAEVSDG